MARAVAILGCEHTWLGFVDSGLPEGEERLILEGLKDKVPARVFTEPYRNPVNDTPEAVRANLRTAVGLAVTVPAL